MVRSIVTIMAIAAIPSFAAPFQDNAGNVRRKWNFMNILMGSSKTQLTDKHSLMFDFASFHDEISSLMPMRRLEGTS